MTRKNLQKTCVLNCSLQKRITRNLRRQEKAFSIWRLYAKVTTNFVLTYTNAKVSWTGNLTNYKIFRRAEVTRSFLLQPRWGRAQLTHLLRHDGIIQRKTEEWIEEEIAREDLATKLKLHSSKYKASLIKRVID